MGTEGALAINNPERSRRDLSLANARLTGKTYSQLAEQFNISKQRVAQILNDDEIKDVIETGAKLYAGLIPKAVDNYRDLLDSKDEKIKHSASKDVLTATGIQPSHTQSIVIQNSFNRNTVELTPEVVELMNSRPSGPVIDVELDLDD
jgi:hypothetical protein